MQVTGAAGTAVTGGIPMHAPTVNAPRPRPVLQRLLVRSWEYRRPRLAIRIRVAAGVFNLTLGIAMLAAAPWVGPLALLAALPLAGAAGIFWTVHRLRQDGVRT
jgi:hypothetical protein